MLSSAYFLAKFRFDTAENEPAKNLQIFPKFANFAAPTPLKVGPRAARRSPTAGAAGRAARGGARGRAAEGSGRARVPPRSRSRSIPSTVRLYG